MFLVIDTTDHKKSSLLLVKSKQQVFLHKFRSEYQQSEKLVAEIEKLLVKAKQSKKSLFRGLKGVIVVTGPGGFTSVRIGVTVANTLAWALGLKIAGVAKYEFHTYDELIIIGQKRLKKQTVEPIYDQEPNITIKKPKKIIKDLCAGGLIYHQGKYLLIEKENNELIYPKGHIEKGESVEKAALREVKEESGYQDLELVIKLGVAHFQYHSALAQHKVTVHTYLFKLKSQKQKKKLGADWYEQFRQVLWLTAAQAKKKVHFENIKKFIDKAEKVIKP